MTKAEKNKRGFFSKLIGKAINPLNHGEDLQEVVAGYEQIFEKYKQLLETVTREAVALYDLRKEAYYTLLRFQTYVNALPSCPTLITNGATLAVRKSSLIKEAMDEEASEDFKYGHSTNNNGLLGVAATGSALAIGGSTALMAIATTFGTAGTGAAISSLSGVAATNAALAWIGGGSIAAGGAGMSGGAAVLGLMGPIGWGIAGLSALTFIGISASKGKKNRETISEIEKKIQEIKEFIGELNVAGKNVRTIKIFTATNLSVLKQFLDKASSYELGLNDYSLDSYPHKELFAVADIAKNLGKVSNQSIVIKK